jgi:hypothetical protein
MLQFHAFSLQHKNNQTIELFYAQNNLCVSGMLRGGKLQLWRHNCGISIFFGLYGKKTCQIQTCSTNTISPE